MDVSAEDRNKAIAAVVLATGALVVAVGTLAALYAVSTRGVARIAAGLPSPYTMRDVIKSSKAAEKGLDNRTNAAEDARAEFHARTVLLPLAKLLGVDKVPLNSWFRSPAVNKAVGGSKTSNHMEGGATDINHRALGMTSRQLFERIRGSDIPFHTLIAYHPDTVGSLHLDSEPGSNRRKLLYRHADGVYRRDPWWS